jgi:phosphoribosylglycinamide formyltransferase-1
LLKIGVLISGGGTNLQSVIDEISLGHLDAKIECVISDRPGAYGIERAKKSNIKDFILDRKKFGDSLSDEILKIMVEGNVDVIVLAGYLSILKGDILNKYQNKILNIHPSLIPSFCGSGMYGLRVHEAAIKAGVKFSGCTVHFVDGGTDTGSIILQRVVPVYCKDNSESLQKRVLVEEHKALPMALKLMADGRITVENGKVQIENEEELA